MGSSCGRRLGSPSRKRRMLRGWEVGLCREKFYPRLLIIIVLRPMCLRLLLSHHPRGHRGSQCIHIVIKVTTTTLYILCDYMYLALQDIAALIVHMAKDVHYLSRTRGGHRGCRHCKPCSPSLSRAVHHPVPCMLRLLLWSGLLLEACQLTQRFG